MAIFGYDKFGSPTTYGGATFAASGFDLSPIYIAETGYGSVTLQWKTPDATTTYSRIRLVRSTTGFPRDETDGANIRETTAVAPSALHTDVGLTQGQYYYYGFFVETDVPTYSSSTVYTRGQIAKSAGGTTYVSLVDANAGNLQTNTTYWFPTTLAKKWVLAGQAVILTTKRYDFTTRLYQAIPPFYRSGETDWAEPVEAAKSTLALASYPQLAKMVSIFGYALDGIQTKSASLIAINNPSKTPIWYLAALADHTGLPLENSASSRTQRVRLRNVAKLARSKGSLLGAQDNVTATLGFDTTVTAGINKVLTWDQADARYPVWDTWDQSGSYAINDYVIYGAATYRALVANRGAAQGPPNSGSNTWWAQQSWTVLPTTSLYNARYGSRAGWIPGDRTLGQVDVLTGANNPIDSLSNGNSFQVTNVSAGSATVSTWLADRFYIRAWSAGVQYLTGELVSQGGATYEAVTNNLGITPGTDVLTWQLFLTFVPTTDPQAVFENAVPVTSSVNWTFSVYVATVTGLAGASASAAISWYTSAGAFISTSTGTASAIVGAWTRRTITAAAPATARYAVLRLDATTVAAGGKFIFKGAQMEQAGAATTWVPPRRAEVLIKPNRINHATNPSFEVNTAGWTAAGTSVAITQDAAQFYVGTKSLKVNAGLAGSTAMTAYTETAVGSVVPGEVWTCQARLKRVVGAETQRVTIGFYTSAAALIGTVVATAASAPSTTGFTLYSLSGVAPATASYLRFTIGDVVQTVVLNDNYVIDAVMIEKTDMVRLYFDAGFAGQEYIWAGTAHASKSFYYQGLSQKRYSLGDIISRSIPHGIPYNIRYSDV